MCVCLRVCARACVCVCVCVCMCVCMCSISILLSFRINSNKGNAQRQRDTKAFIQMAKKNNPIFDDSKARAEVCMCCGVSVG